MRRLNLHVDYGHRSDPNVPELRLFAEVILDAVDLVHGVAKATRLLKVGPTEVAAARRRIRNGNVGALTFNEACTFFRPPQVTVRFYESRFVSSYIGAHPTRTMKPSSGGETPSSVAARPLCHERLERVPSIF